MRNLNEATLYPGIGAFESTNLSVGPRHRHAVRARRRAVDRRRAARRRAERARDSRRPLLSGALHARVEQVRERGVPGRLHHHHRPRRAAPGARRRRDRVGAQRGCFPRSYELDAAAPAVRLARRARPRSRPATIRPRSRRPSARPKRAGGCCARSTCCIRDPMPSHEARPQGCRTISSASRHRPSAAITAGASCPRTSARPPPGRTA